MRTSSCPNLVQLRNFCFTAASAPEAESLRTHLEHCEACRTIVAGFKDGDAEGNESTLAEEPRSPAQRMTPDDATVQIFANHAANAANNDSRLPEQAAAALSTSSELGFELASGDTNADTLAGRADATTRATDATMIAPSASSSAASTSDATMFVPFETPAQKTMMVSDSLLPDQGATIKDSSETYFLPTGLDRAQAGASDSNFPPTKCDIPDGPLPRAIGLEGVTVPGYDILEELGRGGMGVVYKARHRRLRRLVALKMVLAGAHVGRAGLARFRAEAEAVAKLVHPNIVQIFETGEHEGRPFFSLEFVEGGSLDQQLIKSPPTPRGAARFVETLARTMEVAHQRGIVHRDLKPANILLANLDGSSSLLRTRDSDSATLPGDHWSRTTVPKIADFGLAKRTDLDSSDTQSGAILGTPSYMAPEQASGKTREIGPAVDIYALGAILYEMLVGRPPFKAGNPIDTVRQVIEQDPVPPRQLEPRVPYDLETICLKCLEKDPARRFSTAADLADDLRRFVDGDPIHARPTAAWERAWKWGKRRPAIVALLALIPISVMGIVLFVFWHNISLRGQLDAALMQERSARQRELDALRAHRLALVRQEGQKLFDSARVAVAAGEWSSARLDLEKALTTLGKESSFETLTQPAQALLKRVEQELRVEAERRASHARLQQFVTKRDQAQFLGTLYTGMDLAANLESARTAVHQALAVYGVDDSQGGRPRLDDYLSNAQKVEIHGDCYQLLLILAETEAQSTSSANAKPGEKDEHLHKALSFLDQGRRIGTPSRAFHLRRARYLNMLGDRAAAAQAERMAQDAPLDQVLDHFLLGDELYRRERFGEAITEFDQVLERKPGHFWSQYLNAICLLRQGRPGEARALLSACLAERPDFVWLYLLRGFAQEELQAWGAADADFQKAARLPLDDDARYVLSVHRGVLRIRQERFEDAVADLKAAIEGKPTAYQAYVNLAQAYRRLTKLDLALEQLDRAVKLEPGLAHLYRLRARLHLERNEPALALGDFDQAIRRENTHSRYQIDDHVERGRLLLASGKYSEALGSFDAALALQKEHSLGQRLRAETLFRLGRFPKVIQAFDRYLETGKPQESVYRGRGLARAELGQFPGAIDDFTTALELHPTSAVLAYRGWTHLVVDAPKLAEHDFELAIKLDPSNGDAYCGRGFVRASQGQYREAMKDAAEALRRGPTTPRLLYNAARIYAQCPAPHREHAVELIERALSLLPPRERRAFWTTHIRSDAALGALRRHPALARLHAELPREN